MCVGAGVCVGMCVCQCVSIILSTLSLFPFHQVSLEGLRTDLVAREVQLREKEGELQQRDADISRLLRELRNCQTQLQTAQVCTGSWYSVCEREHACIIVYACMFVCVCVLLTLLFTGQCQS